MKDKMRGMDNDPGQGLEPRGAHMKQDEGQSLWLLLFSHSKEVHIATQWWPWQASADDLLHVMALKWRNGGAEPPWLIWGQSSLCLVIDRALQILCTSQEFDRRLCHNFLYNLAPKRSVAWKWLTDRRLWPCSHRTPWAESQQAARPVFTFISLKDKARREAFLLLELNTSSSVLYSRDANQIKWCPPPLANTRDQRLAQTCNF